MRPLHINRSPAISKGLLLAALAALACLTVGGVSVTNVRGANALDGERGRIQRQLESVESDLRQRDNSHLSAELRLARATNLEALRDYYLAAEFPRNLDFPGGRTPYFIDDRGVACAVGHLVIASGHPEVAVEVQARENNAAVFDMTTPSLFEWAASSGLTLHELARIQPFYCACGDDYAPVCSTDGVTFANECLATQCWGVEIAHEGECEGGTESEGGTGSEWPDAPDGDKPDGSGCSIRGAGSAPWLLVLFGLWRRRKCAG